MVCQVLTSNSKTPKVHNVRQPHKDRQPRHSPARKERQVSLQPTGGLVRRCSPALPRLERSSARRTGRCSSWVVTTAIRVEAGIVLLLQRFKRRQTQATFFAVRLGNVLYHLNRLFVLTLGNKILGWLAKAKDQEAQAKHRKGDAAQCKEEIAPTHVIAASTAGLRRG